MIYAISVKLEKNKIINESDVISILDSFEFSETDELTFVSNKFLIQYCESKGVAYQDFAIDWKDLTNVKDEFIVEAKWGAYNKNAPKETAEKIINYCDKVIQIGTGDFSITNLAKKNKKEIVNEESTKRYKF